MLDVNLAKHFAYLFKTMGENPPFTSENDPAFEDWWLVTGRREYPVWAELTQDEIGILSKTVTYIDVYGVKFPVCHAMVVLLKNRPDVIKNYTVNGKLDQIATLAWFYVLGVQEHLLHCVLTPVTLKALDSPIKLTVESEQAGDKYALPTPTVLMMLIWQLLDVKNQKLFDITNLKSRELFLSWFFVIGVRRFKIESLISSRWRIWLQMKVQEKETGHLIANNKLLEKLIRPDKSLSDEQTQLVLWKWLKTLNNEAEIAKPDKQITKEFGVNLYGFAYGELGIGEDLRMAVACCESANIPYRIVNIEVGSNVGSGDKSLEKKISGQKDEVDFLINIFIIPGFDTAERIFLKIGKQPFENHYNVGWWPWELNIWPKNWMKVFDLVDELWGGSQFTFEMYKKHSGKPSFLMPLSVSVVQIEKDLDRNYFDLPNEKFLFLYIFDFNSHISRKNPQAAVNGFASAFEKQNEKVGLVLKVMNVNLSDKNWLLFEALCLQDKRIILIKNVIPRSEILSLISLCDAYISPHRAEGFGRTIAEALILNKTVLSTGYSGSSLFTEYEKYRSIKYTLIPVKNLNYHFLSDDDNAYWSDPDINSIIILMRECVN